jgi:hypothetical protein
MATTLFPLFLRISRLMVDLRQPIILAILLCEIDVFNKLALLSFRLGKAHKHKEFCLKRQLYLFPIFHNIDDRFKLNLIRILC